MIADETRILDMQAKALPLTRHRFLSRHTRRITRQRDINPQPDIRQHRMAGGLGTAQADFFLHSKSNHHFALMARARGIQLPNRLDAQPARHAIIQRLGNHLGTHFDAGLIHHHIIANLHLLLDLISRQTNINKELLDLGNLLSILGTRNMDRPATRIHHALNISTIRHHRDAAREQVACVKPACRVHPQKALVINRRDIKTNLIHVAQQHHSRRTGLTLGRADLLDLLPRPWLARADQVAQRIRSDLIKQPIDLLLDQLADALFATRNARSFTQTLEKIKIERRRHKHALQTPRTIPFRAQRIAAASEP